MGKTKHMQRVDIDINRCGINDDQIARTKELLNKVMELGLFIDLEDYLDVPFIEDMKNTEQDPVYHPEGNVLIHTKMVMGEVVKLLYAKEISTREGVILHLAALLHDVAKPETSTSSNGRVRSLQHDLVGYQKARYILDACDLPLDVKLSVLTLVKEHMAPIAFLKQKSSHKAYEKLAWKVNTRLLYYFTRCDFSGRTADDIKDSLEKLETFKETLISYQLFGETPKRYEEKSPLTAYIMVGPAASGKSTLSNSLMKTNPGAVLICPDTIRGELCNGDETDQSKNDFVFSLFYRRVRDNGKLKTKTLILDATNVNKRNQILKVVRESGYEPVLVYLNTPYHTCIARNSSRSRVVPEYVIKKQYELLAYPNYSEADTIYYVNPDVPSMVDFPRVSKVNIIKESDIPFDISSMMSGYNLDCDDEIIRIPKIRSLMNDLNGTIDRNWLVHLPPTMSPCDSSHIDGYLEHPEDVFSYYREKGVTKLIYEHKYMGSRAVIILCRSKSVAKKYFGDDSRIGVIYSRRGRQFFHDDKIINTLHNRNGQMLIDNGLDFIILDAEILPWNLKAGGLIRNQYQKSGDAGESHYSELYKDLRSLKDNDKFSEIFDEVRKKKVDIQKYNKAYQFYCWEGDEVRIHSFHVLAMKFSDGSTLSGFHMSHADHIDWINSNLVDNSLVFPVNWGEVDLTSSKSMKECIKAWKKYTESGYEGFVFKPLNYTTILNGEMIQPAVKCRGRDYLRIIYGVNYLDRLDTLRRRSTKKKRRNAIQEFKLGHKSLDLFLQGHKSHEFYKHVIGILAMETDPIDPRL